MMSVPETGQRRIVRFYTSIRRIPLFIGKAGGSRLPGGPYTVTQFAAGGLTLIIGFKTMGLWGPHVSTYPLLQLAALGAISCGVLWGTGRLPSTKRKLHNLATDAVGAVTAPHAGTVNGRAVRVPRPYLVTGTVLLAEDEDHSQSVTVEQASSHAGSRRKQLPSKEVEHVLPPATAGATMTFPRPFASGLDRLLAQTSHTKEHH